MAEEENPKQLENQRPNSSNPFIDSEWTKWILSFIFIVLIPLILFILFWKTSNTSPIILIIFGIIYLIPTIILLSSIIYSKDRGNEK